MRLLGAKEFLKTVKPGTLFIEFWLNEQECHQIIKEFESGSSVSDILNKHYGSFHIFGDNGGSLTFLKTMDTDFGEKEEIINIDGVNYDYLWYYDKNIVGDASPTETLNLVLDNESEWPEQILVTETGEPYGCEEEYVKPEDIKRIQKWFVETEGPFTDETSDDKYAWALKKLETDDYYKDDPIVNYKGEN